MGLSIERAGPAIIEIPRPASTSPVLLSHSYIRTQLPLRSGSCISCCNDSRTEHVLDVCKYELTCIATRKSKLGPCFEALQACSVCPGSYCWLHRKRKKKQNTVLDVKIIGRYYSDLRRPSLNEATLYDVTHILESRKPLTNHFTEGKSNIVPPESNEICCNVIGLLYSEDRLPALSGFAHCVSQHNLGRLPSRPVRASKRTQVIQLSWRFRVDYDKQLYNNTS